MKLRNTTRRAAAALAALAAIAAAMTLVASHATAVGISPFATLAGRWTGEGRLMLKSSPMETVKCRATYFVNGVTDELKQNIRCATSGGSIEVLSGIVNAGGALTGHWKETMRNLEGSLNGEVTPNGFKIAVNGSDMSATMNIMVLANKQLIEIQFQNSPMVALSMIMTKG